MPQTNAQRELTSPQLKVPFSWFAPSCRAFAHPLVPAPRGSHPNQRVPRSRTGKPPRNRWGYCPRCPGSLVCLSCRAFAHPLVPAPRGSHPTQRVPRSRTGKPPRNRWGYCPRCPGSFVRLSCRAFAHPLVPAQVVSCMLVFCMCQEID